MKKEVILILILVISLAFAFYFGDKISSFSIKEDLTSFSIKDFFDSLFHKGIIGEKLAVSDVSSDDAIDKPVLDTDVKIMEQPVLQPVLNTEDWIQRYNGPANSDDEASSMVVDTQGNVYVTGCSTGIDTDKDYLTIKYDTNGNQIWVQRYNGSANGWDEASSIVIDLQGNIYVTGHSENYRSNPSLIMFDYATIKYDTDGNQVWVQRYDSRVWEQDILPSIALDNKSNVYVTGYSDVEGGTIDYDYTTIKYDTNGNQIWVRTYDGNSGYNWGWDQAKSIAIDLQGNVYVTGHIVAGLETSIDYATIKYNTYGNETWVQTYNSNNGFDYASSVDVDIDGNVYVTGRSEVYGANWDYATIKYDTNGNQIWVRTYNWGWDQAESIAVDIDGNVYVTGQSWNCSNSILPDCTHFDYATIKYDTNGNQIWVQRYDGIANNGNDIPEALTVDTSGNVYVTGKSMRTFFENYDYLTIKYNIDGNQEWIQRYNGPANSDDEASSIALDTEGNIYITGRSTGIGTGFDYTTIKYGT